MEARAPGQRFTRAAGIALPLFSLRGEHDVGVGEIFDLIPFIDWLDRWHQRIVQLLPISETAPGESSPYNTLSAFAIDPAYISADRVVDVRRSADAQTWLQSAAVRQHVRRWRRARRRNRRGVYHFKIRLLEFGFREFDAQAADSERGRTFEQFRRANAWWLDDYALFRALKERRRWTSWETWPADLQQRAPDTVRRVAAELQSRVRFLQYVQWIAAEQWCEVRAHARKRGVLLKGDLPFVCGRDSADVWAHQELFDLRSSAGAPPDAFSATGQAWGLPLYDWGALRRSQYEWWRQRARQARALYDVFRVDHVVGIYRTYAIAVGKGGTSGFVPADEADQLRQGRDVLAAVLEEAGARSAVVAEDLGNVPDWVRASLTQQGIPGYKILRWETCDGGYIDTHAYSPASVATSGTHDTETLKVWWEALAEDARLAAARSFNWGVARLGTDDPALPWTPEIHLALLRALYEAGSVLTILPIQDVFGWRERINTPATTGGANWTYRLPVEVGKLDQVREIRERMETIRGMIDASGRWSTQRSSIEPP